MRKKTPAKSKNDAFQFVREAKDIPSTQGMLQLVRTELKSEMKAGFRQMDSRFEQIHSEIARLDSRFSHLDSKFSHLDSKFEQMLSEVSRIGLLVEEQNSRNHIVLEGLTSLWQRQQRIEGRVDEWEKFVRQLGRSKA
jgi:hypothetical protein